MPVLPLVGSTMIVSWLILPSRLGGVDHRHADAVLDRPERVEVLELGDDLGLAARRHPAEPDQRRVADRLGDVVVDPPADPLGCRHPATSCISESRLVGRIAAGRPPCGSSHDVTSARGRSDHVRTLADDRAEVRPIIAETGRPTRSRAVTGSRSAAARSRRRSP